MNQERAIELLMGGAVCLMAIFTFLALLDAASPEKLEPQLKAAWDNCTALYGLGGWVFVDATPWRGIVGHEIFCVDWATKERMGYGLPEVNILNSSDTESWRMRR